MKLEECLLLADTHLYVSRQRRRRCRRHRPQIRIACAPSPTSTVMMVMEQGTHLFEVEERVHTNHYAWPVSRVKIADPVSFSELSPPSSFAVPHFLVLRRRQFNLPPPLRPRRSRSRNLVDGWGKKRSSQPAWIYTGSLFIRK